MAFCGSWVVWLWRSFGGAVGDGDFRWGGGLVAVVGCCVKSLVSQVFLGLGLAHDMFFYRA